MGQRRGHLSGDSFIDALLADAAHAHGLRPGVAGDELMAKLLVRLPMTLAQFIANNFSVLDQITGPEASFKATIWRGNVGKPYAGQIFSSIRGTKKDER